MTKRCKTSVAAARRRQEMTRSTAATATQTAVQPADLHAEYRYVLADLKRFGILAASMVVLLVVLALVL